MLVMSNCALKTKTHKKPRIISVLLLVIYILLKTHFHFLEKQCGTQLVPFSRQSEYIIYTS